MIAQYFSVGLRKSKSLKLKSWNYCLVSSDLNLFEIILLKTRKLIHERSGSRYKYGCQSRSLKILNSFTKLIIAMHWQGHEESSGKQMVYYEFTEKELNRTK